MNRAVLEGRKSVNSALRVGAVVLDSSVKMIAGGFNYTISGGYNFLEKHTDIVHPFSEVGYPFDIHAEQAALFGVAKKRIGGGSVFSTVFPCVECTKFIVHSGIKNVYYFRDENDDGLFTEWTASFVNSRALMVANNINFERVVPTV
nr:deoxycytidylate deaminase-like [Lytechinus pictus]